MRSILPIGKPLSSTGDWVTSLLMRSQASRRGFLLDMIVLREWKELSPN